jgi:hypothetical protein
MSCAADLSIFSLERGVEEQGMAEQVVEKKVVVKRVAEAQVAVVPARARVLDLENLTPETLEAFFPSERPVAA